MLATTSLRAACGERILNDHGGLLDDRPGGTKNPPGKCPCVDEHPPADGTRMLQASIADVVLGRIRTLGEVVRPYPLIRLIETLIVISEAQRLIPREGIVEER